MITWLFKKNEDKELNDELKELISLKVLPDIIIKIDSLSKNDKEFRESVLKIVKEYYPEKKQ